MSMSIEWDVASTVAVTVLSAQSAEEDLHPDESIDAPFVLVIGGDSGGAFALEGDLDDMRRVATRILAAVDAAGVCGHDWPAWDTVTVMRCECGATRELTEHEALMGAGDAGPHRHGEVCCGEGTGVPGTVAMNGGTEIQRCDDCGRYDTDEDAARAVAGAGAGRLAMNVSSGTTRRIVWEVLNAHGGTPINWGRKIPHPPGSTMAATVLQCYDPECSLDYLHSHITV